MNELPKSIVNLIQKHLNADLSDQEKLELNQWVQQSEEHKQFFSNITDATTLAEAINEYEKSRDIIYAKIKKLIPFEEKEKPRKGKLRWLSPGRISTIAASILIIGGALVWWNNYNKEQEDVNIVVVPGSQRDRQPAFEGAILQLADGKEIILDDTKNGTIAQEGNTRITKEDGLLYYDSKNATDKVLYNTLSTPKGRVYKLALPDGSRAWLNTASSIRFPAAFAGNERRVEVTGEVFFEVKKDMSRPFYVSVSNYASIEVLGTAFNVNSYDNEQFVRTTLLSGSVRIETGRAENASQSVLLKPGQQAQWKNLKSAQHITVIQDADIEKVIGWKEGYFSFDDLTLEELMREVERWYDVEVVYEKGVPSKAFFGKVSRNLSLIDFMEGLKDWGVRFRLEGRKLIITGVQ